MIAGVLAKSVSDMQAAKEYQEAEQRALEQQLESPLTDLAGLILTHWERAQSARDELERKMLSDSRQVEGVYDPQLHGRIKNGGGTDIFMHLTAYKAQALRAWVLDVLSGVSYDDKMWRLQPSPEVELPKDVEASIVDVAMDQFMAQWASGETIEPEMAKKAASHIKVQVDMFRKDEAQVRAAKLEARVDDYLKKGGFYDALYECINDLGVARGVFLKGPVPRWRTTTINEATPDGNVQRVKKEIVPTFRRVSQYDIYPAPSSRGINDRYLIERMRMTPRELMQCKGCPGFDTDAIDYVLGRRMVTTDTQDIDQNRDELEGRYQSYNEDPDSIEVLDYWGTVPGYVLADWGMKVDSVTNEYEVNCWLATKGRVVIRAVINPDKLGRRPYHKTHYEKIPGGFWGQSLPSRLDATQRAYNAAWRAMIDNAAVASGPAIVYTDISRLPTGELPGQHRPGKVYQFRGPRGGGVGTSNRPLDYFNVPMNTSDYMVIIERCERKADDDSGIPRFQHGNAAIKGAGETASGLSMLMGASAKGIKRTLMYLDNDLIEPAISMVTEWVQEQGDAEVIGDYEVSPQGALELLIRDTTAQRQMQFLAATANPIDMQIIGLEGRHEMLKHVARNFNLPKGSVPDALPLVAPMDEPQPESQPAGESADGGAPPAQTQGDPSNG